MRRYICPDRRSEKVFRPRAEFVECLDTENSKLYMQGGLYVSSRHGTDHRKESQPSERTLENLCWVSSPWLGPVHKSVVVHSIIVLLFS